MSDHLLTNQQIPIPKDSDRRLFAHLCRHGRAANAEIERLNRARTTEVSGWRSAQNECDEAERENERLKARLQAVTEALRDLMEWGVESDDKRLGYIVVQVDRPSIEQALQALSDESDASAEAAESEACKPITTERSEPLKQLDEAQEVTRQHSTAFPKEPQAEEQDIPLIHGQAELDEVKRRAQAEGMEMLRERWDMDRGQDRHTRDRLTDFIAQHRQGQGGGQDTGAHLPESITDSNALPQTSLPSDPASETKELDYLIHQMLHGFSAGTEDRELVQHIRDLQAELRSWIAGTRERDERICNLQERLRDRAAAHARTLAEAGDLQDRLDRYEQGMVSLPLYDDKVAEVRELQERLERATQMLESAGQVAEADYPTTVAEALNILAAQPAQDTQEPPAATALEGWVVSVSIWGQRVLNIGADGSCSGHDISDPRYEDAIRAAATNLAAFVGQAQDTPQISRERLVRLRERIVQHFHPAESWIVTHLDDILGADSKDETGGGA